MPLKTSSKTKKTKPSRAQKAGAITPAQFRALEKKLASREAEVSRLSAENQNLRKETEQRATELQVIDNIGQILSKGFDLNSMVKHVAERLHEVLKVENIAITIHDPNTGHLIVRENYYITLPSFAADRFSLDKFKFLMRLSARGGGRSWVVNTNAEKSWRKYVGDVREGDRTPKSFVALPLLAGRDAIGGIIFADYEKENAFSDLPIRMLETIASNMGTAIQNVRLFDETQRLLRETDQRATELQIINNIGQALTEGLDLNSMIERVAERLHEVLKVDNIGITIINPNTGQIISQNNIFHSTDPSFATDRFSLDKFKSLMRLSARGGNRSWVMNTNAEKSWRKYGGNLLEGDRIPKSFVALPLLVGKNANGGIIFADYEKENAFIDLPIRMLETIAYNMGTGIQNVLLFDETQRLLKETEQRATELQIINNIGQTLTEGGDLESMIQRVGERLQEALNINNIAISIFDKETERVIAPYMVRNGEQIKLTQENYDLKRYKMLIRAWARAGGGNSFWVVNHDIDKFWRRGWLGPVADDVPKSLVAIPLLAGGDIIGGILLVDYEKENAFTDISVNLLETIASNMGTAVQNVRLFEETQRLLKETEQRATELQIINNIGQTLTEGFDLQSTLERVGERLREALDVKSIAIVAFDAQAGLAISNYMYHYGRRIIPQRFSMSNYKLSIRLASRMGNKPLVVNTNAERYWKKFLRDIVPEWTKIPKAFVVVPLLAGGELVGSITISDYEEENAFRDLPINLLETIASNMGTAIQNVRLFDETKKLFTEAEEARAAAEQANKAKSAFLANMSHELRTPLNAIMGFTQIVKGKAQDVLPEKQINNLEKVLTSSQHLLGLINTVLDIAKIEAGRMDVIPGNFSLGGFADQCLALATPLLKPNVTLEKQVDETIGFVFSDQDKIKQIILNLLSNAAKFTHKGRVILKIEKLAGEMIGISVKDSGIGISEEALGRVFEEFQQADNTTTRQYGGTGLGLTISRNLARLLGGDLTTASVLGEGSTFTLTFPMHYQKDTASSAAIAEPVHSAEATLTESSEQVEAKNEAQSQKTILVVEDTELNINFLTQLLEDDYNLIFARNGAQGVTLAGLETPDLILMDISLPIMDGYEATRRIRVNMADTLIIGLSAYAMVGDVEKAKQAGCNDYVTKPVDGILLKNKIKEYLR